MTYVGAFIRVGVELEDGGRLTLVRSNDGSTLDPGTRVRVAWRDEDVFEIQPPEQEDR